MNIGFVLKYFDFRNDIRRLISEIGKDNKVVLFINREDEEIVKSNLIPNIEIRIIDEEIKSIKNKVLIKLFKYFFKIPKSKQNYYLMQRFIISTSENNYLENRKIRKLNFILSLPKFFSYDMYLNNLDYSENTKIDDIDKFLFISEVSNDYFLSRCIKNKRDISVYVYSWDHPFKQIRFSNQVKYLTWCEETKQDLIDMQNINKEKIKVWGSSQFCYIHEYFLIKQNLIRSFKFEYVYFVCATGVNELIYQEIEIIRRIHKIIKKHSPFLKLIVRPYPVNKKFHHYESLKEEGIILDDKFKKNDLSIEEKHIFEKFEKIDNAKILLHLGTTMGLEATFFKTPSLLIDFGYENFVNKNLSIKNFIHQSQNDKYLVDKCSNQHIVSENQLIEFLNKVNIGDYENHNVDISQNFNITSFQNLSNSYLNIRH